MILIGLGANLPGRFGGPERALEEAMREMTRRGLKVVQASRLWLSAPVPASDQPWYRNAVAIVETALDARVLDLDLLAYGEEVIRDGDLTVPHPRLHERAFVLFPLRDVAPGWRHHVLNKDLSEMIGDLPPGQDAKPMTEDAA